MIPGTYYVPGTRYVCTWYHPAEIYTYVRGGTHDTYVPPTHVWRQLHLSAVARCSDSYCIFFFSSFPFSDFFDFDLDIVTFSLYRGGTMLSPRFRFPNVFWYQVRTNPDLTISFERSEFLIPTWVTPQYRAISKKKKMCVCSTNLGFSGGSANRCYCRTLRQYDTRYVRIMYQIRMYLVSAGRNLYVRTLCFCFCFPFWFQHGTPTFLVTKVLGICVRSFIRCEKENPAEILYTNREIPQGASWTPGGYSTFKLGIRPKHGIPLPV